MDAAPLAKIQQNGKFATKKSDFSSKKGPPKLKLMQPHLVRQQAALIHGKVSFYGILNYSPMIR